MLAPAAVLVGSLASQQAAASAAALRSQSPYAIRTAADLTFRNIAGARFHETWQAVQVRRFLDADGVLVQIRERVTVQGNGTDSSPFQLEFLDVIGSTVTAAQRQSWQYTYRSHAGLLHQHGSFAVQDVDAAHRNYLLYDFGTVRRAGREARRAIVFPRSGDKAIWVVDLDVDTGLTLYAAEYDSRLRVTGELEVNSLAVGAQVPPLGAGWNWTPRQVVDVYPSPQLAIQAMRSAFVLVPDLGQVVAEYVLHRAQITTNRLNAEQTLVFGYTDGIDEFFVTQSGAQPDPFANSPGRLPDPARSKPHAIASYDDPAMRVYVFHEKGTTFQVVGSQGLVRLQQVAWRLCRQAVTGN